MPATPPRIAGLRPTNSTMPPSGWRQAATANISCEPSCATPAATMACSPVADSRVSEDLSAHSCLEENSITTRRRAAVEQERSACSVSERQACFVQVQTRRPQRYAPQVREDESELLRKKSGAAADVVASSNEPAAPGRTVMLSVFITVFAMNG